MPKRFESFTLDELKVLDLALKTSTFNTKKDTSIFTRLSKELQRSLDQKQTIATLDKNYARKRPRIASDKT